MVPPLSDPSEVSVGDVGRDKDVLRVRSGVDGQTDYYGNVEMSIVRRRCGTISCVTGVRERRRTSGRPTL